MAVVVDVTEHNAVTFRIGASRAGLKGLYLKTLEDRKWMPAIGRVRVFEYFPTLYEWQCERK